MNNRIDVVMRVSDYATAIPCTGKKTEESDEQKWFLGFFGFLGLFGILSLNHSLLPQTYA